MTLTQEKFSRRTALHMLASATAASVIGTAGIAYTPAQAAGSYSYPVLKRGGSKNWRVRALQWYLRKYGYILEADRDFGPITERKVKLFQGSRGLVVDGIVGKNTWGAMVVDLRKNDVGFDVRAVQMMLDKHVGELRLDSKLGRATMLKFWQYVQRNRLHKDQVASGIKRKYIQHMLSWR